MLGLKSHTFASQVLRGGKQQMHLQVAMCSWRSYIFQWPRPYHMSPNLGV